MVKPRGSVHRSRGPKPAFVKMGVPESVEIAAWSPRDDGQVPTQVHLIIHLPDLLGEVPLVMRFKSPDSLGFLIEELTTYRREVWPDAEPVKLAQQEVELWKARAEAALDVVKAAARVTGHLFELRQGGRLLVDKDDFDRLSKAVEAYRATAEGG